MTVHNPEWAKEFPITVSNDNRYSFYCIPCKKNVQCGHMVAIGDVKQHCKTSIQEIDMAKQVGMVKLHFHFIIAWGKGAPQSHPWIQPWHCKTSIHKKKKWRLL